MAAEAEGPFVLLAPTEAFWSPDLDTLFRCRKGRFLSLAAVLSVNGGLTASSPLKEVLAEFLEEVLPPETEQFIFRNDDATWTVAFRGDPKSVLDSKGMGYIKDLLSNPNPDPEIHCTQLYGGMAGVLAPVGGEGLVMDGAEAIAPYAAKKGKRISVNAVGDAKAVAACKQRPVQLKEKIEEAEELGNAEETSRLKEEHSKVTKEIARLMGYGGQVRREGPTKKARQAVGIAIDRALAAIKDAHPALGRHLESCLRRGEYLAYRPDRTIRWAFN